MWQDPSDRRLGKPFGELELVPDTWYTLLLAIGQQGEMLMQIWNPTKPTQVFKYSMPINDNWAGQPWIFRIGANKGKLRIDDLAELSFDQIIH